jgi:arsenate reductase
VARRHEGVARVLRFVDANAHPEVLEAMKEVDIDLSDAKPQRLTAELAEGASWLVTMGCGDECPVVPGVRRDDWPLEDPKGKPVARVREIREDVKRRVLDLIAREGWTRAYEAVTEQR